METTDAEFIEIVKQASSICIESIVIAPSGEI